MADMPIGSIVAFAGPVEKIPNGWLLCDGKKYDRTDQKYVALFNAIGSSWGGDGVNKFNVPDLVGRFLRGADQVGARDPGPREASNPGGHDAGVGSVQRQSFLSHSHAAHTTSDGTHNHQITIDRNNMCGSNATHDVDGGGDKFNADPNLGSIAARTNGDGNHGHDIVVGPTGDNETRPINAAVLWIIKNA